MRHRRGTPVSVIATVMLLAASSPPAQAGPQKKQASPLLKRQQRSAAQLLARDGTYSPAVQKAVLTLAEAFLNKDPHGDVMATLYHVFKESIEQANDDKRYFLEKLAEANAIGDALSDYLKELNDLSEHIRGDSAEVSAVDMRVAAPAIDRLTDRTTPPQGKRVRAVLDRSRRKSKLSRVAITRYRKSLEDLKKRARERAEALRAKHTVAARQAGNLVAKGDEIKAKMRADVDQLKRRLKKR